MKSATAFAIVAAWLSAPHAARAVTPEPQRLATSCEASAARFVPCPQGQTAAACLLVGDNEEAERLFLYGLDASDRILTETPIELDAPLDDVEALEVDGDRVWVVASHSRKSWKKQCAAAGSRLAIFRGVWSPATQMKSLDGDVIKTKKKEWQELLREKCAGELFQLDGADAKGRELATAACQLFAANDEEAGDDEDACDASFNIEGAAAIPGKDAQHRLWLGLRGPTLDGKALLVRLARGDEFRFDGIAAIDLGEARGVRDMAYQGGRLWLLGGPTKDSTGVPFALESVAIASLESGAQLTPKLVREVREQSEGLAIFPGGRRAAIVTDGLKGDGASCAESSTFFSVPIE